MDDLFSLEGKTALVTGGGRGIGRMIADGFMRAGATTIISSRNAEVCDEAAAELSKFGRCIAIPADLARHDECVRLAGAAWGAPVDDFPSTAWDKVLDVNLKGVFYLTQALLGPLREGATSDAPARIINIGSVDGIHAPGGEPWAEETYSYSASKAALHHLTRVLAGRLGPDHITVNAIAPGPFETKMMAHTLADHAPELARASPLGRLGRPQDIAGAAIYLASAAGAWITGVVLPVDGGIVTTL
jgi:NAD(P)-dependent dehydrogenase (short-subunit alcohol dehydrogenase family)